MGNYDYSDWERLEEEAFREVTKPKRKPKKEKKTWKPNKKDLNRDKKNSWNNYTKRS